MQVSDYRTATTGIESSHLLSREFQGHNAFFLVFTLFVTLADTPGFTQVQQHVADLIKGKVLVGHSLWNDLSGKHSFISIPPTVTY
jgi:RNA exonuclease 4